MDVTKKVGGLKIANRRRPVFVHGSAERQYSLAFPKHVIDYIVQNPKSPALWKKLIQTCKMFFDKNPIVVTPCLHSVMSLEGDFWEICSAADCNNGRKTRIHLDGTSFKLWITENLCLRNNTVMKWFIPSLGEFANLLIPRLFKCEVKKLEIFNQFLNMQQLFLLTSKVVNLVFASWICPDSSENLNYDNIVPFETLLESLPMLKEVTYYLRYGGIDITPATTQKLAAIQHVKSLRKMTLRHIQTSFDFGSFSTFMLDNKQIEFVLLLDDWLLSEEYIEQVEAFVEKVKNEDYGVHRRPSICFNGHDLVNSNNH